MADTCSSMAAPELLAPAGSLDALKAAFRAGADAVYIGGSSFGARAYADNPQQDDLLRAIRYTHLIGKHLHLTVNTLLKQDELEEKLIPFLRPYYEEGLDAVIVQDPGVMRVIRASFPDLPIHVSTQAAASGPLSVQKYAAEGAARVILPRELSLEEIRRIRESTSIALEVFVHGAICYCYSGQCLFSSLAGGRSGNRGRCAQPCRKPYELCRGEDRISGVQPRTLISLKDMNTLKILPRIVQTGVNSLKIEGRMKSPEYTAGVVSIYRKYLDLCMENPGAYRVDPKDQEALFDLFNRDGFSEGYFSQHNGRNMISLTNAAHKVDNPALSEKIRQSYLTEPERVPLDGCLTVRAGEPVTLSVSSGKTAVTETAGTALPARNRPMQESDLRDRMEKIHDTAFSWRNLTIRTDGSSFVPVGQLNELRRGALARMEDAMAAPFRRSPAAETTESEVRTPAAGAAAAAGPNPAAVPAGGKENSLPRAGGEEGTDSCRPEGRTPSWDACVSTMEQLQACLRAPWLSVIFLAYDLALQNHADAVRRVTAAGHLCGVELPRMVRAAQEKDMADSLRMLNEKGVSRILASTSEGLLLARRTLPAAEIAADHTLYAWNTEAQRAWTEDFGADRITMPVELNRGEILRRGAAGVDFILYGHLPMMITAQCLRRTAAGCTRQEEILTLKDRMGNCFPVRNFCGPCLNVIYNSVPQCIPEAPKDLGEDPAAYRAVFTVESGARTEEVLSYLGRLWNGDVPGRPDFPFTRGHYRRGVE